MPAANDDLGEQIVQLLPRLRRFARSLANTVQDADDIVQLAIERALSRSSQLRPEAQLSSWMFGILRNAWIDETRSRGRRTRLFAPEELGENVADPTANSQADALSVQEAMAGLPSSVRSSASCWWKVSPMRRRPKLSACPLEPSPADWRGAVMHSRPCSE